MTVPCRAGEHGDSRRNRPIYYLFIGKRSTFFAYMIFYSNFYVEIFYEIRSLSKNKPKFCKKKLISKIGYA